MGRRMARMKDERLLNSSETRNKGVAEHVEDLTLGWEDCLKGDLRTAEENRNGEKMPTTGRDGEITTKVAV